MDFLFEGRGSSRTLNSYERVKEFHLAFNHPVGKEALIPTSDRVALRLALILEEAAELAEAQGYDGNVVRHATNVLFETGIVEHGDLVAVADALGDLDYVVNGAALEYGINLPEVTKEIHRSNMTKLGSDGKPIYREDGKILKGADYEPPNLSPVLGL